MTDLSMKEFISSDSSSWKPCWSQDTASDLMTPETRPGQLIKGISDGNPGARGISVSSPSLGGRVSSPHL